MSRKKRKRSKRNRHTGHINYVKSNILKYGKKFRSRDGTLYCAIVKDKYITSPVVRIF